MSVALRLRGNDRIAYYILVLGEKLIFGDGMTHSREVNTLNTLPD